VSFVEASNKCDFHANELEYMFNLKTVFGKSKDTSAMRRVVIVTGGARGIGFGIATCFAQQAATVVIADVDGKAANEAAAKLNSIKSTDCLGIECDVTRRDQVEATVKETIARFGQIDVLVNNAGICPFVDALDLTPEIFNRTIDVNVTGALHFTQFVAQHMIERGKGGRIVFITSLGENVINPNQVDYGASKGGLRMLMIGFATALGKHGITCNAVAPGMILTDMSASYWTQEEPARQIKERVPVGRIGTPIDVGHAVVFLASPEAEYISGVSLRVDGGHQTRAV
jgi:NAD(P)-dependent dehydrogenase (short-subunit alcohol dehydrogenase family)